MKRFLLPKLTCIGLALFAFSSSFSQKVKPDEKAEKKEVQQIIINRKGDPDKKTVIEIKGDKVMLNGKDVSELKDADVSVHINRIKDLKAFRTPGAKTLTFGLNDDNNFLLNTDPNRAMLGILTEKSDKGAAVKLVNKGSAAEKAGLKEGDIITRIGDRKIETAEDVADEIHKHKPGDKVSIAYLREGKEQKTTAELGAWKGMQMNIENFHVMDPEMFRNMVPGVPNPPNPPNFNFDFRGNTFGRNEAPKMGISVQDTEDGQGVKVIDVDKDSNADKAGVKEGDVITQVNNNPVNSVDEIAREIRENKDKTSVMLKLQRNGKTQNIEVRLPRKLKTANL